MYIRCTIDVILALLRAIRPAVITLVVMVAVAIPVVAVTLGEIFGTLLSKAFAATLAAISV